MVQPARSDLPHVALGFEALPNINDSESAEWHPDEAQLEMIVRKTIAAALPSSSPPSASACGSPELPWSLSVQLLDAATMQQHNSQYRNKASATNVLSFPFDIPDGLPAAALLEAEAELGDIFICPEVLAREATEQNKELAHHWTHIVSHGVLHLLGYDHVETNDAEEMEAVEIQLLAADGIGNPYL